MFQGEHTNNLDEKGRVSIPASFRDALKSHYESEQVILARDYDGCLRGYPLREWEGLLAKVRRLSTNDVKARAYERYVVSSAVSVTPDRQGRVLVPQSLRVHSDLKRIAVFAGGTSHFEIWDEERWAKVLLDAQLLLKGGGLDF
ncbi:MAG: division/cell wall cluster transcriptional repressor MraZ [Mariprofundaceae bacterium]